MDKLNLNIDDLEVESFETTPNEQKTEGTVRGQGVTNDPKRPLCDGGSNGGDTCSLLCSGDTCNCNTTGDAIACHCDTEGHVECTVDPCYGDNPTALSDC